MCIRDRYYTEDGKFVAANGQVQAGGSLANGIQYLLSLENSGLKLPENLKQRLLKGINTQALSLSQKQTLAKQLGYSSWNQVQNQVNTALSDTDSWSNVVTDVKEVTEGVKEDVQPSILTEGDVVGDTGVVTTPEGDIYTPTDDGQGYTFEPREKTTDEIEKDLAKEILFGLDEPDYGRGRGGTKEKQQQMKQQDTRKDTSPGSGSRPSGHPGRETKKETKYERPGTSGAPGHHW